MSSQQRFLFLQGVCSPFFPKLGAALRDLGHLVRKVNFTAGDSIYWRLGQSTPYRGTMASLPGFYARQFDGHKITDIVLFGDCRPVHSPAIALAAEYGIRVHVYEEGYFRPHWVTLEQNGVNGHSRLPRDPAWFRDEARRLPRSGDGSAFVSPFWKRAAYDVGYNFWAGLNPILHRGVKSHVPYSPVAEYLGYLKRGVRLQILARMSREIEAKLVAEAEAHPFYLLPLQLNSDAQIVHHSPFGSMTEAMLRTLESFAVHAPKESRLAVKVHPLDPGLINYAKILKRKAKELAIDHRVFYLESGNLPALLSATQGVVTVNSTVGSSALIHGRPTIALGSALYNMKGLTFQGQLDAFWTNGRKPKISLVRDFRDVVIFHTQVNGGFYNHHGIELAVANSLPRLLTSRPHHRGVRSEVTQRGDLNERSAQ
ncbi:capsule biosynthesis protein [Bordetella hinzii]|uniref:capsule biosynthesis protein n=1 Tax=Bordetella hinzii TaxID=103855 RepID=UPI000518E5D0|nr:capsular biosynthesis protein [Bordetella hinzii]QDJ44146.1 capsule biosynthesis protein CapA [Bordetella hinzii]